LSRGSPAPEASASPTGEVAGFSVHFHKLSSVVSSGKRTLTERLELESGCLEARESSLWQLLYPNSDSRAQRTATR